MVDLLNNAPQLAGVDVIPYAHSIDAPSTSTVMVQMPTIRPTVPPLSGHRLYEFTLVLVAAKVTPGPADDEIEALVRDVLFAVESNAVPGMWWTVADRPQDAEPTNPVYLVTTQAIIKES